MATASLGVKSLRWAHALGGRRPRLTVVLPDGERVGIAPLDDDVAPLRERVWQYSRSQLTRHCYLSLWFVSFVLVLRRNRRRASLPPLAARAIARITAVILESAINRGK